MKKFTAFSLIFMLFFSNIVYNVIAAVNVGQVNSVLQGDYVVIVNTNLEDSQSTGSIIFDDSGLNIESISEDVNNLSDDRVESITLEKEESNISTNSRTITTYKIGDKKRIGPYDSVKKDYTLIGIGDKCYIWMEDSIKVSYDAVNKTDLAASEMIKVYEGAPYEILNELANNNIPYLDNSGKLSILIENTGGSTGYYYGEKDITAIHVNAKSASEFKAGSFDGLNGLLAHEGQHALFNILTCKGDANLAHKYSWINEGISVAVMDKVWGYSDSNGWLDRINDSSYLRNGSSLLYSDYRNTTAQDYSMPYLFVRYLASQATNNGNPIDFLKTIYTMDATNKSVETFINEIISKISNLNGKTFKDVLGSFYVAAFSPEKTGEYSFYGDAVVTDKVTSYPVYMGESNKAVNLEPTAAIVIKTLGGSFKVPSDAGSDVKFYAVSKNNEIYKPAAGSGTASDPYIITNEDELNSLGKYPTAYFKLGNNIDITKGSFFTVESFSGNLNGNGYSINNLNKPLIYTNNGIVNNLSVNANINMDVMSNFGVIANVNIGTISDVKVSGTLNLNAIVANPVLKATVGGIVGDNEPSGTIERVYFNGNINLNMAANDAYIGGLVGYNMGLIKNSYSKGSIEVSQKNTVTNPLYLGGLVGINDYLAFGASIRTSYSIMNLNSNGVTVQRIGSIIGYLKKGTISHSYGIDKYNPIGGAQTNLDSKKTLQELQTQSTFTNWDFDTVWKLGTDTDKTPVFKTADDITSISGKLAQVNYFVGESLALYGLDKLTVDGKTIDLTAQMLNVSEFDSSTPGENKVINGSYMGKSFTVTYNVVEPKIVANLQILEKGKVDYIEGETYSDKGVVLQATLDGRSTYIYSGYTNNLSSPLTKDNTEVEISYFGRTVTQEITVKEKTISSITVFNKADKSKYIPGNTVDLNGIRYQINYSDGSKTKILGYNDLKSYNLNVAQADSKGQNAKVFDLATVLQESDNNTKLYIYLGNNLPGTKDSISAEVVTLNVAKRLYIEDQTFRAVKDKADGYWYTKDLLNANYDTETTLKKGELPPGIKVYTQPGSSSNNFAFYGTPTTIGQYTVVYTVAKTDGSDSIDVTFTFNVEAVSNEPLLEALTLKQSSNPTLPYDIEGVIDNTNNTIKFTVPYGTDITKLKPTPTYYKNSSLPGHLWNGNIVDFSKPVAYEVTAEDGVTKKTYTVSVEVLPNPDSITSIDIDNKIFEIKVGTSHTFSATVNGVGNFDKSVTWKIEGAKSQNTSIDNSGKLTIGTDETAKTITVIATSVLDNTKNASITINVIDKKLEKLDKVENLKWSGEVAIWDTVENATRYKVSLYKNNKLVVEKIVDKNGVEISKASSTGTVSLDLSEYFSGEGEYRFTVVAEADGYISSDIAGEATDSSNNEDNVIKYENSKPEITANNLTIKVGDEFNEYEDVTAYDKEDGDLTKEIKVIANNVDVSTPGVYNVTYKVVDKNGAEATKTISVTVRSNEKPVIIGADNVEIEFNSNFDKKVGVTATDYEDKDLTGSIVITGEVNTKVSGRYELKYSVTDSDGNTTTVTRVIIVKEEVKPENPEEPTLPENPENPSKPEEPTVPENPDKIEDAIIKANNITIKVGQEFNPLNGVEVIDSKNPNIIENLKYTSDVNTSKAGVYTVKYEVVGSNGTLVTKTISVTVLSNEKPVISGADNIEIEFDSSFDKKAGVTATDYEDKDLTGSIVITGEVNTKVSGKYELKYLVTDSDGNTTTITRIVIVKEEVKPEQPEIPEAPEVPSVQEEPEKPEAPEVPNVQKEHETPEVSEVPSVPEKSVLPGETEDIVKPNKSDLGINSDKEDKEDNKIISGDRVESEDTVISNEKIPQTGATMSTKQVSLLALLLIVIGALLSRRKRK